jgi:hypothetical protein
MPPSRAMLLSQIDFIGYSAPPELVSMHAVSKRALHWYFKCCCVSSVTKMFALKGVQQNSVCLATLRQFETLYMSFE